MILKTKRLILRSWLQEDANSLYKYAKDSRVGPAAGWPVHTSVENSRQIIKDIFSKEETYAVTLKDKDIAIGCVSISIGSSSHLGISYDEAEIGYWIGVPYWGQGLIPEAVQELMRHAFIDLNLNVLWCGCFEGNVKSRRVQEKCGFTYQYTHEKFWNPLNEIRTEHVSKISKDRWETLNRKSMFRSYFYKTW